MHRRQYEEEFKRLYLEQLSEIEMQTGCQRPCRYQEYRMVCITFTFNLLVMQSITVLALILTSRKVRNCSCLLQLWPASDNTFVEREELIYPIASLVAEVGGTFSLFLGFSFITIWDGCYHLLSFYKSTSLKSFLL